MNLITLIIKEGIRQEDLFILIAAITFYISNFDNKMSDGYIIFNELLSLHI